MKKILIIDTDIMCVWLKVPGKETAGKGNEWNFENVSKYIDEQISQGVKLCLPMNCVIETGNHIAHVNGNRTPAADALRDIIIKASNGATPWVVFEQQNGIWESEKFAELASGWNKIVKEKEHSLGDAVIVGIAKYYSSLFDIEIFTGDSLLKEFERKINGQKNKRKTRRNRND